MTIHRRCHSRCVTTRVVIAVCLLAGCTPTPSAPPAPPQLTGKLTVLVRPPARNLEPVSVEEPGSLPVQAGGAMCLDAQLSEPALVFIVWLNSAGQVVPLYPWNNERLEVTDIHAPPPDRRPTKLVFSPLLGHNWTFGESTGLETVLLLARRTPLPKEVSIGEMFATPLPARAATNAQELVVLTLDGSSQSVQTTLAKNREAQPEAANPDEALQALLVRLGEHFELVQAVQFVHGAAPAP